MVAALALVAEDKAPGGIRERLRVGQAHGTQLRRPPQMDQSGGRRDAAELLARRVVAEGARVAVRRERARARDPCAAPPEPGDPIVLEPSGEAPQLGEGEWLVGAGGEVLTRRPDGSGTPRYRGRAMDRSSEDRSGRNREAEPAGRTGQASIPRDEHGS